MGATCVSINAVWREESEKKKEKWERERKGSFQLSVGACRHQGKTFTFPFNACAPSSCSIMHEGKKKKKKKRDTNISFPFPSLAQVYFMEKKPKLIKNDFCFLSVRGPFLNQISFHFSCKEGGFAWTDTNILVLIKRYRKKWEKKRTYG